MMRFPLRAISQVAKTAPGTEAVATTNPFFLPLVLTATRALHGRRVVALVYDLYPDAFEASGMRSRSFIAPIARAMNRYWLRNADGVVFIGDKMAQYVRATYGEPRAWTVIQTGASAEELTNITSAPRTDLERWCEDRIVLSYVGNLGHVHDWETIAAAIPALLTRATGHKLGVVIAGSGPGIERLREAWAGLPADQVRFEDPLADGDWARLLQRSHMSLISLKPSALRTSIPSKTFSAMAAGSGIIAVAPADSDLADIVQQHECGAVIPPGRADELVDTIVAWLEQPEHLKKVRQSARQALRDNYDMPILAKRWAAFFSELTQPRDKGYELVKRAVDVAASGAGLLAIAPILAGAAVGIRLTMGGPVLFRQTRPGKGGAPFQLFKFRTMRDPRPGEEGPEHDGARLTRLGKFLRRTSIDELPTLLNVLRGDMTLVGPRPLLMRYLDRYTAEQARRHEVTPGVTGWAQVNGRNQIGWNEKFALDVWYVDQRSAWLDLHILLQTVLKVVRRDGISQQGHATMPEFMGAQEEAEPEGATETELPVDEAKHA